MVRGITVPNAILLGLDAEFQVLKNTMKVRKQLRESLGFFATCPPCLEMTIIAHELPRSGTA
jgi:hypothetical protein